MDASDRRRYRFRRIALGALGLLLGLLAGLAIYAFIPVSPKLSAYQNLGSQVDVRILRDEWGVPHIFGQTDADAAFGLAYAHAEDDFLTQQQTLLAARGRLASVYGQDAAPNDYMVGLLRIWDVVNEHYERDLTPETRALVEAYADGLTYYAALHQDEVLSPDLFPISGKDVIAASVHKSPLFFDLDDTLAALFSEEPEQTLPTEAHQAQLSPGFDTLYGSNTFAVGPGRSTNGETFLAVNSHQPWEGAVTWYEAHVHSEQGWDTVGALFPVTPLIVHGHNRRLGWAFTVNKPDLIDIYRLELDPHNPDRYRFDGRWLELESRQVPIQVKLLGRLALTVQREALWSVYGPVIRRPHATYALRYAGYGRVDIFQQLYRMNKAQNFDEWHAALRDGGLPTFNVGYADADGNIYYVYNALAPNRPDGYDWSGVLPGNTSATLWEGYRSVDELPQVLNPPAGFIQNANSTPYSTTLGTANPQPGDFPASMGVETRLSNRALRALELFGGDDSISFEEFQAYKFDRTYSSRSDVAAFVRRISDAALPHDSDLQEAQAILRAWDLRGDPASPGMTLAVFTLHNLLEDGQPVRASGLVGAEVPDEALRAAFTQAVAQIKQHYGRIAVPWGEANRLVRGDVDLPLGGGPDLLRAVYGHLNEDGRFIGFQGDSYVLLAAWDAQGRVHSLSIHQYGSATQRPTSPHYADQAPLFAAQQLKPVWLEEAEIRQHLEREYRP